MKRVARLVGKVGLLLMIGLIVHEGCQHDPGAAVSGRMDHCCGWCPLHLLPLLLDVLGWRTLLERADPQPDTHQSRASCSASARCAKRSIGCCRSPASAARSTIAIRLLVLRGVPGAAAAASVIVEMMLVLVSQFTFRGARTGVRLLRVGAAHHWSGKPGDVAARRWRCLPVIVAVLLLLRYGSIFERSGRWVERLFAEDSLWRRRLSRSGELDGAVRLLYRSPARLLAATAWQLSGLIAGTLETPGWRTALARSPDHAGECTGA